MFRFSLVFSFLLSYSLHAISYQETPDSINRIDKKTDTISPNQNKVIYQTIPRALISQNNGFVDAQVLQKSFIENTINREASKIFHLFSHGQSGALLIGEEWLDATQIAKWLKQDNYLVNKTHLNIYGCNFAKGEKGRNAVEYLEKTLGISVAASDDITGIDGDWDLEVGQNIVVVSLPNYAYNLQGFVDCATIQANNTSGTGNVSIKVVDGTTYTVNYIFDTGVMPPVINGTPHSGSVRDIYLAIYDANCNQTFGTYLGAAPDPTNYNDYPIDLEVDANGNIAILGTTEDPNFPTTDGTAVDNTSDFSLFLAKYSPTGSLIFNTVIPASFEEDEDVHLNVGSDGSLFISGELGSSDIDLPTTDGSSGSDGSGEAVFAMRYDALGTLIYSRIFDYSGHDDQESSIVIGESLN